jgi:AraC-like DNA-binding protein
MIEPAGNEKRLVARDCCDESRRPYRRRNFRLPRVPSPRAARQPLLCLCTQAILGTQGIYSHRVLPVNDGPPVVVGPWTQSFLACFSPGTTIVGARFHPGQASALLGLPASELLNQSVPLDGIWKAAASAPFARVVGERTLRGRQSSMEVALLGRLAQAAPADQVMTAATHWFGQHPHGRTERLSQSMGLSNRQLHRRFLAAVGYGPKLFHSVLRFQRLLNLWGPTNSPRRLAHAAADAGYADQAHMTRDVQRFAGVPPSRLLQSAACSLRLSGLVTAAPGASS